MLLITAIAVALASAVFSAQEPQTWAPGAQIEIDAIAAATLKNKHCKGRSANCRSTGTESTLDDAVEGDAAVELPSVN